MDGSLALTPEGIHLNITALGYDEGNNVYFYTPEFDLYGYGRTEDEAFEGLSLAVDAYMEFIIEKGILSDELTRLGWRNLGASGSVGSTLRLPTSEISGNTEFSTRRLPHALPSVLRTRSMRIPA